MNKEITSLDQKINESPNNADLYLERAWCYFNKRKYENVIEDCKEAIRLKDKYADAHALLSFAYYFIDDDELALRNCKEALSIDDNNHIAYTVHGSLHRIWQEYDQALKDFEIRRKNLFNLNMPTLLRKQMEVCAITKGNVSSLKLYHRLNFDRWITTEY